MNRCIGGSKKTKVEPTAKYKYSTVASGATPIGNAGRAPDKDGSIRKR
jgi:hypothetical protein